MKTNQKNRSCRYAKKWFGGVVAAVTLVCTLPLESTATQAADSVDFDIAYMSWQQNDTLLVPQAETAAGESLELPETTVDTAAVDLRQAQDLPTSYSLLDVDGVSYITAPKDQGSTGLCWAYSAIGACESNILLQGLDVPDEAWNDSGELDLSEASLAWYIYTNHMYVGDLTSGDYIYLEDKGKSGGNASIASYALAAGIGLQLDCYAPLSDWDGGYSEYQRYVSYYRMESSDIIWELSAGSESVLKQWLMESGAVSGCYYSGDQYYDNGTSSAYYQSTHTADDADHAILIVGWDDNYAKENFESNSGEQPSHDGAWLVRNSWGDDDAYGGYFWMSYEEPSLCELARFQLTEQTGDTTYYQYDGGVSYSGIAVASAANIFTAEEDCTLTDVMFPMIALNAGSANYHLSLYLLDDDATDPDDGTLLYTGDGTVSYGGYKSIALDETITIEEGDRFSAVLSLSGYQTAQVPYTAIESEMQTKVDVYCYLQEGQSYVQDSSGTWIDVLTLRTYTNSSGESVYENLGNVAIKVLATSTETTANTAQLEAAMAYGEPSDGANALYQTAYAAAVEILADDTAQQWEIDNAAENLLAGLEKEGQIAYPSLRYATYSYMLGDMDEDGEITILDASLCLSSYASFAVGIVGTLRPAQIAAGDIDGDGCLSLRDSYQILHYYATAASGDTPAWNSG